MCYPQFILGLNILVSFIKLKLFLKGCFLKIVNEENDKIVLYTTETV